MQQYRESASRAYSKKQTAKQDTDHLQEKLRSSDIGVQPFRETQQQKSSHRRRNEQNPIVAVTLWV